METMTFGKAIIALKQGKMVQRDGWNGRDMFVFRQVPAHIPVETVVPSMQSLPEAVKKEFVRRLNPDKKWSENIYYSNQLALVKADNSISGWSPSSEDALADDWVVL